MHFLEQYSGIKAYCDWVRSLSATVIDEFAVASALAAMGACISPTRNTPYDEGICNFFILVAGSGVGKRAPTECLGRMVRAVHPMLVPDNDPNSANGLLNRLKQQPAILYINQEFAIWFENMCASQSSAQQALVSQFLKLWDTPGQLEGTDVKRSMDCQEFIKSPIVNIFGNMTREALLRVTRTKGFRHDGLGGRFEPIIYDDESMGIEVGRLQRAKDKRKIGIPESVVRLIQKQARMTLEDLKKCERTPDENNPREFTDIKYREREAYEIDDDAELYLEEMRRHYIIMSTNYTGVANHILTRMGGKIIRTACILAAYDDREVVKTMDIEYARDFHLANFESCKRLYQISSKEDALGALEEQILQFLQDRNGRIKWSTVYDSKPLGHINGKLLRQAKDSLIASGKITEIQETTRGRPANIIEIVKGDL